MSIEESTFVISIIDSGIDMLAIMLKKINAVNFLKFYSSSAVNIVKKTHRISPESPVKNDIFTTNLKGAYLLCFGSHIAKPSRVSKDRGTEC